MNAECSSATPHFTSSIRNLILEFAVNDAGPGTAFAYATVKILFLTDYEKTSMAGYWRSRMDEEKARAEDLLMI